jgi:exopolysaccharide biosynthesis polyprenyl glycosylphosphotransferase
VKASAPQPSPEAKSVSVAPYRPGALTATRVAADAVALATAGGAALALRFGAGLFEVTESSPLTVGSHVLAVVLWEAAVLLAFLSNRLYDEDTLFPGGGELARVLRSVLEGAAVVSAFVFLTQSFYVSRSWFGLTIVLSVVFVMVERMAVRSFLARARGRGQHRRPALLVSQEGRIWDEWPLESESEFQIVAHVKPADFETFAQGTDLDDRGAAVILRARDFTNDQFWRILILSGQRGWSVFVHSPVRSVGRDRLTLRELSGQTIVKVAPPMLTGARAVQKRALDLIISTLLLITLAPLLAMITIAVVSTSGFPVLYKQDRMGMGGRPFSMLKFRTMRNDAESETGPVWTVRDDPRRTLIGRFLRRTSFDELPQMLNVIAGHMSLVGPRPERPTFVGEFSETIDWYAFRHRIRPGVTGWAQAHGLRGNTPLDSRTEHDNWYIENWSVPLDLKILLKTFGQIVHGRNAY